MEQQKTWPWWYAPMTICAMQEASDGDPLRVADRFVELGYNTEQMLHAIGVGYYACYDPAIHREKLQRYLEHAHGRGLRIILYVNTHIVPVSWEAEHPEYFARDREGKLLQAYNKHYAFVDAASPWRDLAIESTRAAVELGVDGIFSDGPVEVDSWASGSAEFFQRETGRPLAELGTTNAELRQKSRLNRQVVHRFVHDLSSAIKTVNPHCLFYTNLGLETDPGDTLDAMDVLGSEGGFSYYTRPREVRHWKAGFTSRVLEGWARGKPRVNFLCADFKPWFRTLKPAPDLLRQTANALQHGSNYWIGWHARENSIFSEESMALAPLNRLVAGHPEIYGPTQSLARIALYWSFPCLALDSSAEATDFYAHSIGQAELVAEHSTETHGWCRALIASHIPFDVVTSRLATHDDLARYETLVLPAVSVLTPDEMALLTEWVQNGGRLIVSGDVGRLNEQGEPLPRPALAKLLGIGAVRGIEERANYNFMQPSDEIPPWLGPQPGELLPSYTRALLVEAGEARSYARFHEATVGQYTPLGPLTSDAILSRQAGRGEMLLFAGNIGETYGSYGLPHLRQLMAGAVTRGERGLLHIENAPGFLEISVRRSVDAPVTTVHLVNHGGDFEQPTETPVTLHNLRVTVYADSSVQCARALVAGVDLPVERDGEYVTVNLPPVEIYEAVVFS